MIHSSRLKLAFFGTPQTSVEIFEYLRTAGFVPELVVTNPDKPQGRKLALTAPPVKLWALKNHLPLLQPENLTDSSFLDALHATRYTLFIVVAYGKIMPSEILKIPEKGVLNVHYSLLPKYRGASPIETTILNDDRNVGVSILLLDEKMDHGPIVAESLVPIPYWPPTSDELRSWCNKTASKLLGETITLWIKGEINAREQDHAMSTYTKKINKHDGLIDLNGDPYNNFLKIQAYSESPGTYFFANVRGNKKRITVKAATLEHGKLIISRVIPEGKREMDYNDYIRGLK